METENTASCQTEENGLELDVILRKLEAEVHLLERKHLQFCTQKQVLEDSESVHSLENVLTEIQELEQLVKENEILSGLTISEVTSLVLEQDETCSLRQHIVSGEAGSTQFRLQYDVREYLTKVRPGEHQAEVYNLEMDVHDDMASLLQTDLFSVAADVSVRELLQLLASYGLWIEDRDRTINHFIHTFPDLVHAEEQEDGCRNNLIISDSCQGLKLKVVWGLRVLPMKSVVPNLQLQVEAAPEVLARDTKGMLSSAADVFPLMCKKFGIERAVHILVKLLDDNPS